MLDFQFLIDFVAETKMYEKCTEKSSSCKISNLLQRNKTNKALTIQGK